MSSIKNLIRSFPFIQNERVFGLLEKKKNITVSGGTNYSSKAFVFADVIRERKDFKGFVWVVNGQNEQDFTVQALKMWTDLDIYTVQTNVSGNVSAKNLEREKKLKIMETLSYLKDSSRKVMVVPYYELLKCIPEEYFLEKAIFLLKEGEKVRIMDVFERLITAGYLLSDDLYLRKGTYHRNGDQLTVFPVNSTHPIRIDLAFDEVEGIVVFNQDTEGKEIIGNLKEVEIFPVLFEESRRTLLDCIRKDNLIVEDELDVLDEYYEEWNANFDAIYGKVPVMSFVTFNEEEEGHAHLHYLSVLKFRGAYDLANDLKDKYRDGWRVIIFSKDSSEVKAILADYKLEYSNDLEGIRTGKNKIFVIDVDKDDVFPAAFQNPELKLSVLSDREISSLKEERKKHFNQKVYLDFLTSLKTGDYVVHVDHGIGHFFGLEKRTVDDVTREYMKIGYAENDKLFVPIDQADKVNKYIGADDQIPKLTRLGSAEWHTITKKLRKETEELAKELLVLYAQRKSAQGFAFKKDDRTQELFEEAFEYEETPGQMKAAADVKSDMEGIQPMDRLVCGDVGFGKTEVAMRAAFKAFRSGKQVAVISPITILADQHYRSFNKRMDGFNARIEMLSRFRTPAEQKKIVKALERGEIDIIIGTHRLLQKDIKFKDLGLVIVDEEQRFGVKQKEELKQLKNEVDILTLTATPIPRTLNIALNKLRDISTITTPPPGRLPIITEVRRFSHGLIRETILKEVARGGQVYFLHNRVQTIDSMADKLRILVPEARFGVAHGKLGSSDLEERIVSFKDHKFDVLVSSTIIENGIDLSNANTLIVNNADRFGLSQLYQLRGRVGRGKAQAYAYFLYHGQRLKLDAKKRLRAIVEASELGSGFQIAMKDLEIRGAGDILGAKQHGVINVVGVSHFIRMLNKAVDDLKAGKVMKEENPEEVQIELPLTSYIPDTYIINSKDKISIYQKLSGADNCEYLKEIKDELIDEYGLMPKEVLSLFQIIELKILARFASLVSVKAESVYLSKDKEIILHMSNMVKAENVMSLLEYNHSWVISGNKLKIKLANLGFQWVEELKTCLKKLSESIKPVQK